MTLLRGDEDLHVFSQNLIGFWSVATRPQPQNGLGLSPQRAERYMSWFERLFELLEEPAGVYGEWHRLVLAYGVVGRPAHDGCLVASMKLSGIDKIHTLDVGHFSRYAEVKVVEPHQVV